MLQGTTTFGELRACACPELGVFPEFGVFPELDEALPLAGTGAIVLVGTAIPFKLAATWKTDPPPYS
jgi:hypothetical protein